ncbi:class I adenylate-forming enzyme family protein [Nocardioides massiliensis]|uniref:Acyl-CoA synthetase (AMP-forming)/AMP-acid ligase II n=1 Tax=Nocardioides massiliensis TaxID=1325935 RepID=A0ABT9NK60_9ACTN|nr:AMP-binding protein [Nocardioides massiliensis]MDP9820793.1 acyl-CoA synthetase (AMP-forming)/AMP-acid ligase II [Nocardioides massiliensis]
MDLNLLLDMVAEGIPDRAVLGTRDAPITAAELQRRAANGAAALRERAAGHLVYIGISDEWFSVSLFAASAAGVPFVPLNFRLATEQLASLVAENDAAFVVAESDVLRAIGADPGRSATREGWANIVRAAGTAERTVPNNPDSVALLLYTSGTTAAPKAAVLRHRHLTSYVFSNVDFGAAGPEDCALVAVPPYHIAGVANTVTNLYAGRRVVQLRQFTPAGWLECVSREGITQAMVVPTMLARIVAHLEATGDPVPATLRSIAYGGAAMPARVIEKALELFPDTDFVNAYGLTETSSTIAVLGPQDHRAAMSSDDPAVRARLNSTGRLVDGLEAEVRDSEGRVLPPGQRGLLFVRGDQVSGEYRGRGVVPAGDWFATRDLASIDADGYLFIHGRSDDTIIRGGENVAPSEIEQVLEQHPTVAEAAVVGVPDEEWGQRIAAAVVARPGQAPDPAELRDWVRAALRGSKTPDQVLVVHDLPRTDTGKVVRRALVPQFVAEPESLRGAVPISAQSTEPVSQR